MPKASNCIELTTLCVAKGYWVQVSVITSTFGSMFMKLTDLKSDDMSLVDSDGSI